VSQAIKVPKLAHLQGFGERLRKRNALVVRDFLKMSLLFAKQEVYR